MRDRFMNGYIAGGLAGLLSSIIDIFFVNILKFGTVRYIDFASILMYGHPGRNLLQNIVAQFGQLLFSGITGVGFAVFIKLTTEKFYMLKSVIYGLTVWFFAYTITMLYQVPYIQLLSLETTVEHFIAAFIYGIILSIIYRWLIDREKKFSHE